MGETAPYPLVQAWYGPLVGEEQTVPRAEMYAVLFGLKVGRWPMHIHTDCKLLETGYKAGPHAEATSNQDLWSAFWAALHGRGSHFRLTWHRAHTLDGGATSRGALHEHPSTVIGNYAADLLAKKAAARVEAPIDVQAKYEEYSEIAGLIIRRITAIAHHIVLTADKRERSTTTAITRIAGVPASFSLVDALRHTKHSMGYHGRRWHCTTCVRDFPSSALEAALGSPCDTVHRPGSRLSIYFMG